MDDRLPWGTPVVVKRNKRLHIEIYETEVVIYTPPDFVHLHSREPLRLLALQFALTRRREIDKIARFEYENYAKRK